MPGGDDPARSGPERDGLRARLAMLDQGCAESLPTTGTGNTEGFSRGEYALQWCNCKANVYSTGCFERIRHVGTACRSFAWWGTDWRLRSDSESGLKGSSQAWASLILGRTHGPACRRRLLRYAGRRLGQVGRARPARPGGVAGLGQPDRVLGAAGSRD